MLFSLQKEFKKIKSAVQLKTMAVPQKACIIDSPVENSKCMLCIFANE